ncbi:hypothetical protein WJX72_000540 [[Myrmecia] bisecta]|uniref:Acyl carrier protein n=1 Tax=[Myrmecia] bisecta TaxID=41462 RepID=A0AAW1Q1B9_9CHLO
MATVTRAALPSQARPALGAPLVARRMARSSRCSRIVTRAADKAAVLADVREVIAEQLGIAVDKVEAGSSFVDDLGADSLDTVEIMMALEEKFDLQLDEEGAEKVTTVQDAANLIADQVNKQ